MKVTLTTHPEFNREELSRYSRQLLMPEWGAAGQAAVRRAKVVIIGVGGLGCPAARYLAASGIGRLHLIDDDVVSASNLHRQLLFSPADVGQPKAAVAAARLSEQFPSCQLSFTVGKAEVDTIEALIADADVVVDGTDNFASRYLINDACQRQEVPLCHASIGKFQGQASVFLPGGPCYRCVFPESPPSGAVPNCDVAGVIGVLPGTMALIQATEALKLIAGVGQSLAGRVLLYDSMAMSFHTFQLHRQDDCPGCGDRRPTITTAQANEQVRTPSLERVKEVAPQDLAKLPSHAVLVDVREPAERQLVALEPSLALPLPLLLQGESLAVPQDQPVVLLCKSGVRAKRAAAALQERGYRNVMVLAGGILAYGSFISPKEGPPIY